MFQAVELRAVIMVTIIPLNLKTSNQHIGESNMIFQEVLFPSSMCEPIEQGVRAETLPTAWPGKVKRILWPCQQVMIFRVLMGL